MYRTCTESVPIRHTLCDPILIEFDLFNPRYKICVSDNGTSVIQNSSHRISILSSFTFEEGNIGEFEIKCIEPGQRDSIGITSYKDIINTNQPHLMDLYRGNGDFIHTDNYSVPLGVAFSRNDFITVKVDCIEWKIIFIHNDTKFDQMDIEPYKIYYPYIRLSWNKWTEYELVRSYKICN